MLIKKSVIVCSALIKLSIHYHLLPPRIQDVDTANTCLVSDNTFTKHSLETRTSLSLPVSLPDVSDLPGFNDINGDVELPLNAMAAHHSQADLTSVPMDTGTQLLLVVIS